MRMIKLLNLLPCLNSMLSGTRLLGSFSAIPSNLLFAAKRAIKSSAIHSSCAMSSPYILATSRDHSGGWSLHTASRTVVKPASKKSVLGTPSVGTYRQLFYSAEYVTAGRLMPYPSDPSSALHVIVVCLPSDQICERRGYI